MSFVFHPAAEAEFNKAIEYYEEIESGLGQDLAVEVMQQYTRTCLPQSLACSGWRGETDTGSAIPIRRPVLRGGTENIYSGCDEPSPRSGILEVSSINAESA